MQIRAPRGVLGRITCSYDVFPQDGPLRVASSSSQQPVGRKVRFSSG